MRNIITILLLLISSVAFGQGTINFGASRSTDTGLTKGQLKFTAYANSNTSRYLTVNSNGYVVFGVPAGGGSAGDSTVFFTVYRADTMRIGIYGKIRSDSVLMRGLITSLTNYTDSLYTVLSTKQGADSLLLAGQISTLQSDVVTLDSALGVAFGAISELYDTLPNYVPYTGATTDVNIGTHNILPNSVRLSTSPTGTLTNVGQIYWDVANVTPSIPLNANVTLQMGQEEHIRARNNTGVQINDGQVVYINDAQGNNPTIALANSDSVNTSEVIGVATENIADNGTGFVTTFGIVNGFNTSSFSSGDVLYLNTVSGQLSNTIPSPPHNVVKVAIALNSANNGKIFVQPSAPLGQDTTFAAPYNSDRVAPTQRSIGTYTRKIVRDTASALRTAINTKYGTSDTGRTAINIVTGGGLNKVRDSLNTLIATKGSGTVTSITGGYGLTGGTITTTGTISVDSIGIATRARVQKAVDSLNTTIAAKLNITDTANIRLRPIAGTNMTITGTYPNLTFASTGGGGSAVSATSPRILYKSGSDTLKGATRVLIDSTDGRLVLAQNTDTASVSAYFGGGTKIVGRNRMGMSALTLIDTVSIPAALQRALNAQITSTILPGEAIRFTNNFIYAGMVQTSGTVSPIAFASYSSTSTQSCYNRITYLASAAANQSAGLRIGNAALSAGIISGNTKFGGGGGRGTIIFSLPVYNSGQRIYAAYTTSLSMLLIDPGALGSAAFLAVGKDAGDAVMSFYHNDNFGSAIKVPLPVTPNSDDVYRFTVYIAPNSTYYMQLEVISKTGIAVYTLNPTSDIPPVNTRLQMQACVNSASTSVGVQLGIIQITEEIY